MPAAISRTVCTCDHCTPATTRVLDRLALAAALIGFALLPGRALFQLIFGGIS
jgi:hypothetical protein